VREIAEPFRIRSITFDCTDPYSQVVFWSRVTGFSEDPGNRNEPGDPEGLLVAPDGRLSLLFIRVGEPATERKGRRLDLVPMERTRDEEVDRLLRAGALMVADNRPDGNGTVVLADPEGNEFCVERSLGEGGAPLPDVAGSGAVAPVGRFAFRGRRNQGAAQPETVTHTEEDAAPGGPAAMARVARLMSREVVVRVLQLVRLLLLVVEALIAVRIFFKLLGANAQSGFASFLYRITAPLVAPFHPVFADRTLNGHPFEVGSLLAMAVYFALAYLVVRVVRVIFSPSR
jgi:hypothetical protein